jgi:hypothetical protein
MFSGFLAINKVANLLTLFTTLAPENRLIRFPYQSSEEEGEQRSSEVEAFVAVVITVVQFATTWGPMLTF